MSAKHFYLLPGILLLLGCEGPRQGEITPFTINAGIIGKSDTTLTIKRDGFGQTEVRTAEGNRGWLSVALITTNSAGVISSVGEVPRLTLKGWKTLKGKQLAFGKHGKTGSPNGDIDYERFSFEGNSCFHFHKLQYRSMTDGQGRYRRILTGYVCDQKDSAVADENVTTFLNDITLPPVDAPNYMANSEPVTQFDPIRPIRIRKAIEGGCLNTGC